MTVVERARISVLRVPQAHPVRSSYATYEALGVVVAELTTSDGVVGRGWTNVIGGGAEAIGTFATTELVPLVVGAPIANVRHTWEAMFRQSLSRGRKGVAMYALSAMDIALWDARAQTYGVPLHHLLGATASAVPVYGDGCWMSYSVDELVTAATEYAANDFWGVKVKVGADLAEAMRRIRAVQQAIGPDRRLMVDANQALNQISARRLDRQLQAEGIALEWLEEPLVCDSPHDYARLTGLTVPIAAGENEYSRYGFRELVEHDAVDILQPDVHRVGGITEFLRIIALADAWNIPVAPHTSWELHAPLLACATTGLAVEYFTWFPEDFFETRPVIDRGMVTLSTAPGIGARPADESLVKYAV